MEWTKEDLKFVRENKNKMMNKELGEALGRNKDNVRATMQYYGIKRSKKAIMKFRVEGNIRGGLKAGLKRIGKKSNNKKRIKYKRISCIYPELSECWICISHIERTNGYHVVNRNKKRYRMSRYVWLMNFGKIPEGMLVCHKCDTPECINPDHLFLGTQADNINDAVKKGRAYWQKEKVT